MSAYSVSASYPKDTKVLFFVSKIQVGVFDDMSCFPLVFHDWLQIIFSGFVLYEPIVEKAYPE